jgi:hypothetical protein
MTDALAQGGSAKNKAADAGRPPQTKAPQAVQFFRASMKRVRTSCGALATMLMTFVT